MNLNTLAAFINDDITTVSVAFINDSYSPAVAAKSYVFKCMKTLAACLAKDDIVVVDTKYGLQLAKVISVDEESQLDVNSSNINYKWVVCKVPLGYLADLEVKEQETVKALKAQQRANLKAKALEMFASGFTELTVKEKAEEFADPILED